MIKIGVSACFLYPDPGRTVFGLKTLTYLESDMARYLSRRGILPILIPNLAEENLKEFLEAMDGFVFQGGSDIAPQSYGEEPIRQGGASKGRWPGDPERDAYELKILDYAVRQDKPVLGICRGCQLINVYFGGTLYQDIASQKEGALVHRDAMRYDHVHHRIEWKPGGLLGKVYKEDKATEVNSVHHQGIKDLGKDLLVEAISPQDQLVEAVSYKKPDEKLVLGVQWHPEFSHTLKDQVIRPEPLYDYFLKKVKGSA
ncbi:MAG: gamma-glutamyl-gamma-aminobutyrate hydrolase family protein [Deltaproteobacteria bacterium]|nr:gamma-glutamyl-gamma-aminobutyrate hydrolase family protein [Deltaproteobacteria bacterium]